MEKIEIKGQKKLSLQDSFLNQVRKTRSPVCIFLVNGIKLQGFVRSFDQYVVVLSNSSAPPKSFSENDDPNVVKFRGDSDTQQMVYKHAISTIVPGNGDHRDKPRSI